MHTVVENSHLLWGNETGKSLWKQDLRGLKDTKMKESNNEEFHDEFLAHLTLSEEMGRSYSQNGRQ